MSTVKVAISIDRKLLERLDTLVKRRAFASRSGAIQEAVEEKLDRIDRSRLARECAKLDRRDEQESAEEGISRELAAWPEY